MSDFVNNDVSPGAVVQASDHNTQGSLLAAVINGGIDNGNIATNAAIAGSKLADGSVTAGKLDSDAIGHGFLELKRTTLSGAADTISVTSIPARKYLLILLSIVDNGSSVDTLVTFNNDTGNNYAQRTSNNGGADSTSVSRANLFVNIGAAAPSFEVINVLNVATREKLVISSSVRRGTAGAGNAPNRFELVGKWANTTDQITRVDVSNISAGDFAAGSEVVVLGKD